MFARNISEEQIHQVLVSGEIIKSYLDDKPHPSFLVLGYCNEKALHLVIAKNTTDETCILITAYYPNEQLWNIDFKTKK
jgi:hypothetical protein